MKKGDRILPSDAPGPGTDAVYVTVYDPARSDLGGAAWIDSRMLAALPDHRVAKTFFVSEADVRKAVPLEIRDRPAALFKTLARMTLIGEPYITAKFRQASAWRRRARELKSTAKNKPVITSQWPALLLALDAGVEVRAHIAHNVDHVLSEIYDPRPLRALRNAKRTKRTEIEALRKVRSVYALSATDAERLGDLGVPARHIPFANGTVAHGAKSDPHLRSQRRKIGFIGKASWPPNRSAMDTLLNETMPELRAKMGDLTPELLLAGRGTEGIIGSGVSALGAIPSVTPFYERIDLVVIPRGSVSSGVSVKLLEALEHGVTVIAPFNLIEAVGSPAGCIPATDPNDIRDAVIDFYTSKTPTPLLPGNRTGAGTVGVQSFWDNELDAEQ